MIWFIFFEYLMRIYEDISFRIPFDPSTTSTRAPFARTADPKVENCEFDTVGEKQRLYRASHQEECHNYVIMPDNIIKAY